MIDRIKAILKEKNVSPSRFADEIGVQRSAISHLISGRNKPSLEFVQKIMARYPEIRIEWLLNGSGSMVNENNEGVDPEPEVELKIENEPVIPDKPKKNKARESLPKETEKIVYFFRDGTFREYNPES